MVLIKSTKEKDNLSVSPFVSKLLTAVVNVEDIYKTTLSRRSSNKDQEVQKFDEYLLKEIIKSVNYHFKEEYSGSKITDTISRRLTDFNKFFKDIKTQIHQFILIKR